MKKFCAPFLALFVAAGCTERTTEVQAPPAAAEAPAAAAGPGIPLPSVEHSRATDLVHGDEAQQLALGMSGGEVVAGTAVSADSGSLVGISFLVGNYRNASSGGISLQACVQDECRTSVIDTAATVDNQMLTFPFETPLEVSEGGKIAFTLTREAGANQFAIWTYPAVEGASRLDVSEPAFQDRTPRIRLLFE